MSTETDARIFRLPPRNIEEDVVVDTQSIPVIREDQAISGKTKKTI